MTEPKAIKSINVNAAFDKKTIKENMNTPLFTVKGVAERVIEINTKYGEQVGVSGDFVAVNHITGEVFVSDAAFLPKQFTNDLKKMLEKSENNEVEFTATIKAIDSDKNAQGYAWVATAPETQERVNRRTAMLQDIQQFAPKQLAAPDAKPATAAKGKSA